MTRGKRSLTLLAVLLLTPMLLAEEPKKCTATAKECEQQIREMLSGRKYLGVQLIELQPGLAIKAVVTESPAEKADLRAGDRIMAVNGRDLSAGGIQDFKGVISGLKENTSGRLWIIIQRHGAFVKTEARLEPYSKAQIDKIVASHLSQFHTAVK